MLLTKLFNKMHFDSDLYSVFKHQIMFYGKNTVLVWYLTETEILQTQLIRQIIQIFINNVYFYYDTQLVCVFFFFFCYYISFLFSPDLSTANHPDNQNI